MISQINKILFTTDLSEGARALFQQTVYLAECYGASITLLHVIEDIPESSRMMIKEHLGKEAYAKLENEKETYARNVMIGKQKEAPMIEQVLNKLSEDARNGSGPSKPVEIDKVLVTIGRIDEQICIEAGSNNCDLIVMGYHTRTALGDALLGGTVRRVIRNCKRQVHLVPVKPG